MTRLSDALTDDHRICDALFEGADDAAQAGDWTRFSRQVAALRDALQRHFRFEEDELFPAFEDATGMREGPTAVMRLEHTHMRNLLNILVAASPAHDPEGCRAEFDNLYVVMQQHNAKEEGVLYPVCDRLAEHDALLARAEACLRSDAGDATLDVRDLDPPEPFTRIMQRLTEAPDAPLRVWIHREPFPLYEVLQEQGFRFQTQPLASGGFEIMIERAGP